MPTYLTDMIADVRDVLMDNPSASADRVLSGTLLSSVVSELGLYKFSEDWPCTKRKYYQGAGEYDYELPSDWEDDFSKAEAVEFPATSQEPDEQETKAFTVYEPDTDEYTIGTAAAAATSVTLSTVAEALFFHDGDVVTIGNSTTSESNRVSVDGNSTTGVVVVGTALANTYTTSPYIKRQKVLRFLEDAPSTTQTFLLTYTTFHTLDESTITISTALQPAFKILCASLAASQIASKYRYSKDSSINADSVDHLAKADMWDAEAKRLLKMYRDWQGGGEEVNAASVKGEYDLNLPWGAEHVFHARRWR